MKKCFISYYVFVLHVEFYLNHLYSNFAQLNVRFIFLLFLLQVSSYQPVDTHRWVYASSVIRHFFRACARVPPHWRCRLTTRLVVRRWPIRILRPPVRHCLRAPPVIPSNVVYHSSSHKTSNPLTYVYVRYVVDERDTKHVALHFICATRILRVTLWAVNSWIRKWIREGLTEDVFPIVVSGQPNCLLICCNCRSKDE